MTRVYGLTRVNPGWPIKPGTRLFDRINFQTGFNNYDDKWWLQSEPLLKQKHKNSSASFQ